MGRTRKARRESTWPVWLFGAVLIAVPWSCGTWMGHDVFELSWPVSIALGGALFVLLAVVVWWFTSA